MAIEIEQTPVLTVYDEQENEIAIPGLQGKDGKVLEKLEKTSGDGKPGTDTKYTMKYNDGTSDSFQVHSGRDGVNGKDGTTVVDGTLSKAGEAADAKATGDLLKNICNSFEETGPIVQCHPVPKTALGVKTQISVRQEGSGDPSPDNVRPFVPYDKAEMTRCGRNLANVVDLSEKTSRGMTYRIDGQRLYISGTASGNVFIEALLDSKSGRVSEQALVTAYGLVDGLFVSINAKKQDGTYRFINYLSEKTPKLVVSLDPDEIYIYAFWKVSSGAVIDDAVSYIQIEQGNIATPYEPYNGQTYTAELPPDTYGGEVDWEKKKLIKSYKTVVFNGTESMSLASGYDSKFYIKGVRGMGFKKGGMALLCSHYKGGLYTGVYADPAGSLVMIVPNAKTTEEFKAYLKGQYDAKTPVIVTGPAEPPFTEDVITTSGTPAALPGVNTLYSSTGDTTVSGLVSPAHEISELKKAILTTGGNI